MLFFKDFPSNLPCFLATRFWKGLSSKDGAPKHLLSRHGTYTATFFMVFTPITFPCFATFWWAEAPEKICCFLITKETTEQ